MTTENQDSRRSTRDTKLVGRRQRFQLACTGPDAQRVTGHSRARGCDSERLASRPGVVLYVWPRDPLVQGAHQLAVYHNHLRHRGTRIPGNLCCECLLPGCLMLRAKARDEPWMGSGLIFFFSQKRSDLVQSFTRASIIYRKK